MEGIRYEQLLPWMRPEGDAFRVITGDYVSTEDGTGTVSYTHLRAVGKLPTFYVILAVMRWWQL